MPNGKPASAGKFTSIRLEANADIILEWQGDGSQLQFANQATGPWTDMPGALSPSRVTVTGGQRFYRLYRLIQ